MSCAMPRTIGEATPLVRNVLLYCQSLRSPSLVRIQSTPLSDPTVPIRCKYVSNSREIQAPAGRAWAYGEALRLHSPVHVRAWDSRTEGSPTDRAYRPDLRCARPDRGIGPRSQSGHLWPDGYEGGHEIRETY